MIPLRDELRSSTRPYVTYLILAVNVAVFIYETALGRNANDFILRFGAVPQNIFHPSGPAVYFTLISSMFIHAGFMHILGNMLFLWVFSDNVEDRIGHVKYLFFYLACGITGALAHGLTAPNSLVPMVGASGAISGVLGAYILFYPRARVMALIPLGFFMRMTYLPSIVFLGIWFLYQLLLGVLSIGVGGGGVAYFAHIGGFAAGLLIALPFKIFKRKNDGAEYKIL
jgi:membrane associated rhomboid family serine protease